MTIHALVADGGQAKRTALDRDMQAEAKSLPSICFVAPYAYPVMTNDWRAKEMGGAELQQSILAKALAAKGYRVSMITLDFGQPRELMVDGVRVLSAFGIDEGLPGFRFFHPRLTSMVGALKRADADIYYVRSATHLTGIVETFCRQSGKSWLFASAHDLDLQPGAEQLRFLRDRLLFRFGVRRADEIVVQNPTQQMLCQEHFGREATVIRSAYASSGKRANADGCVLWVSTVRDWKRPELFLDIARALPHIRFRMIGGDGGEPAYFDLIAQIAAACPNVEMSGFTPYPEVEREFDNARLFVNTSTSEGFPNTFLQAWSRGMPTVSFFDPGFTQDGQPLVRVAGNLTAAIAEVKRLMTDASAWQAEGTRCRQYYETWHSPSQAVTAYEAVFARIVRKGS